MEALPGIGEVRAGAIVTYREANGPFASVDAVTDVSGIGPATLEAIRDLVEVR
jgi:competence protein ComEA